MTALTKKIAVVWAMAAVLAAGLLVPYAGKPQEFIYTQKNIHAESPSFLGLIEELRDLGWEPSELTTNEGEKQRVMNTLQYDALRYLKFKGGPGEMTLLVVYWSPGRWDPRLVDEHTPAACFPAAGWTLLRLDERAFGIAHRVAHGTFDQSNRRIDCYWWHLVGGEIRTYTRSNPLKWFMEALAILRARGTESQVFVRFCVWGGAEVAAIERLAPSLAVLRKHGYVDKSGLTAASSVRPLQFE